MKKTHEKTNLVKANKFCQSLSPSLYRGSTVHMLDTATATVTYKQVAAKATTRTTTTTQTKSLI